MLPRLLARSPPRFIPLLERRTLSVLGRNLATFSPRNSRAIEGYDLSVTTPSGASRPIILSHEQQRVLDMVLSGKSVFFTGAAGTGKSFLLRQIVHSLRVGLGNAPLENLVKRARYSDTTRRRLREAAVLVIDEISMVDARWFDTVNALLKAVRRNRRPFGGIQLVICGDFFQLPPVPDHPRAGEPEAVKFAFEAESWKECVPTTIRLTKVFRQAQPELISLLNDLREGIVSPRSERLLRALSREVQYHDGIQPTELFPHRFAAETANRRRLEKLKKRAKFSATDKLGKDADGEDVSGEWARPLLDRMAPLDLELAVGAQVMCTKNITDSVINGSVGIITRITRAAESEYSQFASSAFNREEKPRKESRSQIWPRVNFDNGETMIMDPLDFEVSNEKGKMAARRRQVPLIPAWALTIHKAQGQTLQRVKVDLSQAFANGQAYVALSRCTTLQGLQVLNFSRRVVFCDPKVVEWSKNLTVVEALPEAAFTQSRSNVRID